MGNFPLFAVLVCSTIALFLMPALVSHPAETGGIVTSIWELDPATGKLVRISAMDRSAVPPGQTESDPADFGDWESSGILDVTHLFTTAPSEVLLVGNIQAHSVRDGDIKKYNLVQGGQIVFFSKKR